MNEEPPSTPEALRAGTSADRPPSGLKPPLEALWWLAKGDWETAHRLVQDEEGRDASWVHAHLHRVEGDLTNARYWYWQAGRQPSEAELEDEWTAIAGELLRRQDG